MDAQEIRSALRGVIDPELGINIVDLGLVYDISTAGNTIQVRMTVTTPACPLGDYLVNAAESALARSFPHHEILVELVWEPQWHPAMITEESRRLLGLSEAESMPRAGS